MKTFSLALLVAACAVAHGSTSFRMDPSSRQATLREQERIPIVRFSQDISEGSDAVSFEAGNGIILDHSTQVVSGRGGAYEDGDGKMIKTDSSIVKTGSYQYTSPEGLPILVKWVADENGFRAEGSHLPVAPALPAVSASAQY
ncbi:Endocuticle structural glycoprotein SgAbd-2 [Orchesella cincta]|uniref:Endocuticle structural glycoprotein SgAbd-2 n=1 Tax=Orchesella cincta TaxID=48709 RepID=A0A1D2MRW3_ORCCI|nr:Endocuticle structural glycoprotein SgAbd-2 [Orchesella cincta]